MSYEHKLDTGTLFPAEKAKEKSPDLTGKANIDGAQYYISAWKNEASSGKKYLSLKFKPVINVADLAPDLVGAHPEPKDKNATTLTEAVMGDAITKNEEIPF